MLKKSVFLFFIIALYVHPAVAQELFYEGFDEGSLDLWTIEDDPQPRSGPSDWRVDNGMLRQLSNIWAYDAPAEFIYHLGTHAIAGNSEWTNYTLNAILRSGDDDGIGIIFRYQDPGNYYRILLMNDAGNSGSAQSRIQRIQKFVNGEPRTLLQNKVEEAFPAGFFSLTADVRDDSIKAYLNGQLIGAVEDDTYDSGKIGLLTYANSGAVFDSILVSEDFRLYEKPDIEVHYAVDQDRQPYIQNPTLHTVEIAWRSLMPAVGTVEYGLEKGVYNHAVSEEEPLQKHHLKLAGLEPDTKYFYRVKNGNDVILEDYSFSTMKPESEDEVSFLILGDSGVNNDIQRRVRDQMVKSYNEDATDFLIHVGDVHQGSGDDYDPIYFDIYRELLSKMNFYLSIGNHDTYTDNAGPYLDDFYYPTNNADSTERYYSYRWANAFFINIDSNLDMREGSLQYAFIKEALESESQQSADWTFAYFHHPPYCEFWPDWDGDDVVRKHLMPLLEEYGVDMVLNGHTHAYEHGELNGVHYVISGGGGGGLDTWARDVLHITKSEGIHHFSRIDIDGKKLSFKAIDEYGELVDAFEINKQTSTGIEEENAEPASFRLLQNYPNPFNPETTIQFDLPRAHHVKIEVYDSTGKIIRLLLDEYRQRGSHSVQFEAENLPSGVYLYRLTAGEIREEKQMTLIK